MPDAFPQLARCFEAQYRGLRQADKDWLAVYPEKYQAVSRIDQVCQRTIPLWTVVPAGLVLVGFKEDVIV